MFPKNWNIEVIYIATKEKPADAPSRDIAGLGLRVSNDTLEHIFSYFEFFANIDFMRQPVRSDWNDNGFETHLQSLAVSAKNSIPQWSTPRLS